MKTDEKSKKIKNDTRKKLKLLTKYGDKIRCYLNEGNQSLKKFDKKRFKIPTLLLNKKHKRGDELPEIKLSQKKQRVKNNQKKRKLAKIKSKNYNDQLNPPTNSLLNIQASQNEINYSNSNDSSLEKNKKHKNNLNNDISVLKFQNQIHMPAKEVTPLRKANQNEHKEEIMMIDYRSERSIFETLRMRILSEFFIFQNFVPTLIREIYEILSHQRTKFTDPSNFHRIKNFKLRKDKLINEILFMEERNNLIKILNNFKNSKNIHNKPESAKSQFDIFNFIYKYAEDYETPEDEEKKEGENNMMQIDNNDQPTEEQFETIIEKILVEKNSEIKDTKLEKREELCSFIFDFPQNSENSFNSEKIQQRFPKTSEDSNIKNQKNIIFQSSNVDRHENETENSLIGNEMNKNERPENICQEFKHNANKDNKILSHNAQPIVENNSIVSDEKNSRTHFNKILNLCPRSIKSLNNNQDNKISIINDDIHGQIIPDTNMNYLNQKNLNIINSNNILDTLETKTENEEIEDKEIHQTLDSQSPDFQAYESTEHMEKNASQNMKQHLRNFNNKNLDAIFSLNEENIDNNKNVLKNNDYGTIKNNSNKINNPNALKFGNSGLEFKIYKDKEKGFIKYIGETKGGKFNGRGIFFHPNGTIKYKGYFKENKYEGLGIYITPKANLLFIGEFKNDFSHGKGVEFANNMRDGSSNISDSENSQSNINSDNEDNSDIGVSKDELSQGMNKNIKKFVFDYSIKVISNYKFDNQFDYGINIYDDFSMIEGSNIKGAIYGFGTFYNSKCFIEYQGGFYNDRYNGLGIYFVEKDKTFYFGELKNNEYDGLGIFYNKNFKIMHKGEYKNGQGNGFGIWYNTQGNKVEYIGYFKNGYYDGNGVLYDVNTGNVKYMGKFKRGILTQKTFVGKKLDDEQTDLIVKRKCDFSLKEKNASLNLLLSKIENYVKNLDKEQFNMAIIG